MEIKLLMDIFKIPSMSRYENKMREFIKDWLKENAITFEEDGKGNIFNITNKNMPLVSAHMDTVQGYDDTLLTKFIRRRENIISGLGIIGADDKNGIFIVLELLKEFPTLNFAFFVEEEIGGFGSSYFVSSHDEKDFDDILYGLIFDRKGKSDILCVNNQYGTQKFQNELIKVGKDFNYFPATGTWCDADNLNSVLSCTNLSCGYYNAHTKKEYVKIDELENSLNYAKSIINKIDEKFDIPDVNKKRCSICKSKEKTGYTFYNGKFICENCLDEIQDEYFNMYDEYDNEYYRYEENLFDDPNHFLENDENYNEEYFKRKMKI